MNELIQPYVTMILQAVLVAAAGLLVAGVYRIRDKVIAWLETRTTAQQREILHRLAGEAFAFAETMYTGAGGPKKLQEAEQYLNNQLAALCLPYDSVQIRAALEKAVLEHNSKVKAIEIVPADRITVTE